MPLVLSTLIRPGTETYDAQIRTRSFHADLVSWIKGGGTTDEKGVLVDPTTTGTVAPTGAPLPETSEQASNDHQGANISYPHPGSVLALTTGSMVVLTRADSGSLGVARGIVERLRSAGTTGSVGFHWSGSAIIFEIWDGTDFHQVLLDQGMVTDTPYCLAASWGPDGTRMRVNGVGVGSTVYGGGVPAGATGDWLVGAVGWGGSVSNRWDGSIAHLQIYKRQLSDLQLDELNPF